MEFIQDLFNKLQLTKESIWISQVFVIVFVTLTISFFQKRAFNRLQKKLTSTKNPWDDLLIGAAGRPLSYLVWLVGILFAAEIVQQKSQAAIFNIIDPIRDVGVVSILIFFLLQLIKGTEKILVEKQSKEEQDFDQHTVQAIGKLVRISVFITGG
ncbi:MAG: mechanosensitive ion channel family protein, partial [Ghiorsea sp.]|nr:mechanosensitive ion channel family protein [Ghiorsea sp.]